MARIGAFQVLRDVGSAGVQLKIVCAAVTTDCIASSKWMVRLKMPVMVREDTLQNRLKNGWTKKSHLRLPITKKVLDLQRLTKNDQQPALKIRVFMDENELASKLC